MEKIEKGKWYVCIKDVIMKPDNSLAYKKGKIYKSESDEYLTDEDGDRFHAWYDCVKIMEYFRPATAEEIPHDPCTNCQNVSSGCAVSCSKYLDYHKISTPEKDRSELTEFEKFS